MIGSKVIASKKKATEKWPFFCQLYVCFSQNWDSDGHFEVLNKTKSCLVQLKWHEMQKRNKRTWVFLYKVAKTENGNIRILCYNLWTNQFLDLSGTSKWKSEPHYLWKINIQFAEKWPEMVVKWAFVIVIRFDSEYMCISAVLVFGSTLMSCKLI